MLFHIALLEDGQATISPFPELEAWHYKCDLYYTSPGIPLGILQDLLKQVNFDIQQIKSQKDKWKILVLERLKMLLGSEIHSFKWNSLNFHSVNPAYSANERINQDLKVNSLWVRLEGRLVAEEEFLRLASELKLEREDTLRLAHQIVLKGSAAWTPAVSKNGKRWYCERCGKTDLKEWPSLYGLTATCQYCTALGAMNSNKVLFKITDPMTHSGTSDIDSLRNMVFSPHWELTEAQQQASKQLLTFVQSKDRKEVLVWAACGAGKTEICFPAIAWALRERKKVLFAAPRQDVVHDVVPRLERDFPGIRATVLTGISQERFGPGQIVLATTHQILRFKNFFDLVILDEIDAYPYNGNEVLEQGLKNALRENGKLIYLTATPSQVMLKNFGPQSQNIIRLPARHHKKPVPIPIWKKMTCNPNNVPAELQKLIQELVEKGPVLVFVPKISWVQIIVNKLNHLFQGLKIGGSYSSDPDRANKVRKLKNGYYQLFVTTSILERSITIPNVQVIVFAADHPVFDNRSLIQMAGRVGRTSDFPEGEAIYLAQGATSEIKLAINLIQEQNEIALSLKLLDSD